MRNIVAISLFALMLVGCDLLVSSDSTREINSSNIVASVGENTLLKSDMNLASNKSQSTEDSTRLANEYVENWIRKELFLREANSSVSIDLSEIEKKVSDYRYTLLSFEYQRLYIQQNLDTTISKEEILNYYEQNQENFALRQNIIKGKFIKLSKEAPKKNDVRRWIKSLKSESKEALNDYAFQYANNYVLDTTWVKFDEIIRATPFSTISNKVQFLRRTNYVEESDSLSLSDPQN